MADQKKKFSITQIFGIAAAAGVMAYLFSGGFEQGVADSFEEEYYIAKRSGVLIDVCVRAGLVAESYLQAKNQTKYQEWKSIQKSDCKAAGVPN